MENEQGWFPRIRRCTHLHANSANCFPSENVYAFRDQSIIRSSAPNASFQAFLLSTPNSLGVLLTVGRI